MSQTRVVTAMAMDFRLTVGDAVTADALDTTMEWVLSDLTWVDSVFSTYREDSAISRLNRGEIDLRDAPPAVAEVLDLCERFREETGGAFDARSPSGDIDPTGVVKTWAMERVRWRLQLLGSASWMWACAGDLMVSGRPDDAGAWRVGIADPRDEAPPVGVAEGGTQRAVGAVDLGGRIVSLATSGSAHRGAHIWDPATGEGAQHYAQASVAGKDLIQCDAWATAIVAGGKKVALAAQREGLHVMACRIKGGQLSADTSPGWPAVAR